MRITIVSLFPQMFAGFLEESIVKRAQEKGAVTIEIINLREFAVDAYGSVDERPYGGGAGMVLRLEPTIAAIKKAKATAPGTVVLTGPRGTPYSQAKAEAFSQLEHLIICAGHYEGIDERIYDYVDEEVSLGDFIMTGGEITAAAVIDSVVRLLPGVLKKDDATVEESFSQVAVTELLALFPQDELLKKLVEKNISHVRLLEYPHYTRPQEYEGKTVPEVLLNGNHDSIRRFRLKESYLLTKAKRPDILK